MSPDTVHEWDVEGDDGITGCIITCPCCDGFSVDSTEHCTMCGDEGRVLRPYRDRDGVILDLKPQVPPVSREVIERAARVAWYRYTSARFDKHPSWEAISEKARHRWRLSALTVLEAASEQASSSFEPDSAVDLRIAYDAWLAWEGEEEVWPALRLVRSVGAFLKDSPALPPSTRNEPK